MNINNWLDNSLANYGIWKHVFHKGTKRFNQDPIKSNNWDEIMSNYSEQSIGVWLSPFVPVLRICINVDKTIGLENQEMNDDLDFHPHSQDLNFPYQVSRKVVRNHYKNDNTNMEIFDIKNIPVNKLFMISVNVNMNMLNLQ